MISPHLDDAALSTHALLDRTEPADVMTVFTAGPRRTLWTRWDLLSGFADSDEAASARLEEEHRAFSDSPHRLHHLGLMDRQYRGHPAGATEETALVDWVRAWVDGHDGVAVVAIPAIAGTLPRPASSGQEESPAGAVELTANGPSGLPMLPRPLRLAAARVVWMMLDAALRIRSAWPFTRPAGRTASSRRKGRQRWPAIPKLRQPPVSHEDHRFVRDTVWKALQDFHGVTVVFYEELPYSWSLGADSEVRRISESSSVHIDEKRIRVDRVAKSRRVGAYRSQMPVLFSPHGPLNRPSGLPAEERYWVARFAPAVQVTPVSSTASSASQAQQVPARAPRPGRTRTLNRVSA
ncbi:MAG TPA: hypothetical protein VES01_10320 [Dermatophilaceae bacterium]|nr:hypothetical protein [Dermatophilaceae bacterium]